MLKVALNTITRTHISNDYQHIM